MEGLVPTSIDSHVFSSFYKKDPEDCRALPKEYFLQTDFTTLMRAIIVADIKAETRVLLLT